MSLITSGLVSLLSFLSVQAHPGRLPVSGHRCDSAGECVRWADVHAAQWDNGFVTPRYAQWSGLGHPRRHSWRRADAFNGLFSFSLKDTRCCFIYFFFWKSSPSVSRETTSAQFKVSSFIFSLFLSGDTSVRGKVASACVTSRKL